MRCDLFAPRRSWLIRHRRVRARSGLGTANTGSNGKLCGLASEMLKLLWRDLLDVPQIGFVVWLVLSVDCFLVPPIDRPLVSPHEILASQNRMHFVPDDCLAEIQAMLFEERWLVAAVGIAAPNVEATAWNKHSSDVAKPSVEQTIELVIRNEIICKRSSLGSHCLLWCIDGGCCRRAALALLF